VPRRLTPLITDQIYHIYNRGIDHRRTFIQKFDYRRALEAIIYYQHTSMVLKLAQYRILSLENKKRFDLVMKNSLYNVQLISYCLMPNHFHLLIRQKQDNGISKFLSNFQNSYTRFFNTKYKRLGPLFLIQFKAVLITTDEQLLHVHRYIHLNPYASFIVKNLTDLISYPWSSMNEYLKNTEGYCNKEFILSFFKKTDYSAFIFDQADHQRKLKIIKHLTFE